MNNTENNNINNTEILSQSVNENIEPADKDKNNFKSEIFDWIEVLVHAILAVVLCFSFLFRIATIEGNSMKETLHNGEKVIITNLFYTPKVGDIVVVSRNTENSVFTMNDSNKPIIKRIIATEGQTVDIDFETSTVYVDGVALKEDYIADLTKVRGNVNFPVTVGEDEVFVLGDNRNNSRDSRFSDVACVDYDDILGKAVLRFLPFSDIRVF